MGRYTKAITAALITGYAMFTAATGLGTPGGEGLTLNEWVALVVAVVLSGLGVWAVPNLPAPTVPVPMLPSPDAVTTVNVGTQPVDPRDRPS
jgi:hypothetical protein